MAPEEVMSPWALKDEKQLAKLGGWEECPERRNSRRVQGQENLAPSSN